MVTAFDDTPLMLNTNETDDPGATVVGTSAFTWYKPTKPGASPAKLIAAGKPPMVTVGTASVLDWGLARADAPVAGVLETAPSPLQ